MIDVCTCDLRITCRVIIRWKIFSVYWLKLHIIQGCTLWCAPGSVNMRWKNYVLLPAEGRRKQLFHLIFTEPGEHHKVHPCRAELVFCNTPCPSSSLPPCGAHIPSFFLTCACGFMFHRRIILLRRNRRLQTYLSMGTNAESMSGGRAWAPLLDSVPNRAWQLLG